MSQNQGSFDILKFNKLSTNEKTKYCKNLIESFIEELKDYKKLAFINPNKLELLYSSLMYMYCEYYDEASNTELIVDKEIFEHIKLFIMTIYQFDKISISKWKIIQKLFIKNESRIKKKKYYVNIKWIKNFDFDHPRKNFLYFKIRIKNELLKNIYLIQLIFLRMNKRFIILNVPIHGNLGDQAIVKGELNFFYKYFSTYKIIEINCELIDKNLDLIKFFIKKNDIIFLNGGGYLGTLWLHEENRLRKVVQTFNKNKIIVFPQTVYFSNDDEGRKQLETSKEIYSSNPALHVILRDLESYNYFQENFKDVKSYLYPDMVTFLESDYDLKNNSKVLLCLRSDKEKNVESNVFDTIKDFLLEHNEIVEYTDTVINQSISSTERDRILKDYLNDYGSSKLVITDRLHGMIFAAITGTPCIAFDNISKKVSGVYEWIKSLEYIRVVNDFDGFVNTYNDFKSFDYSNLKYSNPNKEKFDEMHLLIKNIINQ